MAVKVMSCVVCSKSENVKYRCPRCRQPYCSVTCCKDHKLKCIEDTSTRNDTEEDVATAPPHWEKYNYETEDTVPIDKLENLRNNEKLKDILGNPHLRRMMEAIDKSTDAATLIGEAMKEPIFTELADEVLRAIGENGDVEADSEEL